MNYKLEQMGDLIENQFVFNSLSEKIINNHNFLIEPFRQSYPLREIKTMLVNKFSARQDHSKLADIPDVLDHKLEQLNKQSSHPLRRPIRPSEDLNSSFHLHKFQTMRQE